MWQDAQEIPDQIAAFSRTMGAITVEDVEPVIPAPMDISEDKAEAFSRNLRNVEDIDANDRDNPQLVSEYVNEIYEYMRSLEVRTCRWNVRSKHCPVITHLIITYAWLTSKNS